MAQSIKLLPRGKIFTEAEVDDRQLCLSTVGTIDSQDRDDIIEALALTPSDISQFVTSKDDFPSAVNGVITLTDNKTYLILDGTIDLTGDRLVCGQNTSLIGGTSENTIIKSTGLSAGTALISSEYSLPMRFLTITHGTALDLDATGNSNQAIDWIGVNFTDCATIGTIKNYNNFILTDGAFLNSQGMTFDGTIGTVAFNSCLFDCSATGTAIIIPATATISRRFRVIYSSFIAASGETALNVSASATIPNEGYILDTANFTGGGTYITGVQYNDNKALFTNCKPIDNSGNIAQYYMNSNATTTTIAGTNTFVKVAGTTSAGSFVEKFTLTNNRATYAGSLIGFYKITAFLTFTSGANNVIRARIGKGGTTTASSESKSTANTGGRSENLPISDIVSLSNGDYIEIFVANESAVTNITVSDMNVIIERLN